MKTIFLIFTVALSLITTQILLKKGVSTYSGGVTFSIILHAISSPYIIISVVIQLITFFIWLLVLSRVNVGYAFGVSGAFTYLILPVVSWYFYNEKLLSLQWIGLIFIALGVIVLTVAPSITK